MPRPVAPSVSLSELHPDHRGAFAELDRQAASIGLAPYEGYRTPERQTELAAGGASGLSAEHAPHPLRVARDYILAELAPGYRARGYWWTGVESVAGRRTLVLDAATLDRWLALGEAARALGLEHPATVTKTGDPDDKARRWRKVGEAIGWDPYHCQAPDWTRYTWTPTVPEGPVGNGGAGLGLAALAVVFS